MLEMVHQAALVALFVLAVTVNWAVRPASRVLSYESERLEMLEALLPRVTILACLFALSALVAALFDGRADVDLPILVSLLAFLMAGGGLVPILMRFRKAMSARDERMARQLSRSFFLLLACAGLAGLAVVVAGAAMAGLSPSAHVPGELAGQG